jgi:hypothetical protein
MTYPTQPSPSGMPPWARWTLIGCAGCLTVVILGFVGCGVLGYYFFGRHMKIIDMSDKPDLPLTATTRQLLPPRVDSFVRTKVLHSSPQIGGLSLGPIWKGYYASGSKHVELEVKPTAAARLSRSQRSPFGSTPPQTRNPNMGIHMTIKIGAGTMDIITWSKPNWTFTVQSPNTVAEAFVRAYHPGIATASPTAKT